MIPVPDSSQMECPECHDRCDFAIPYTMLFLDSSEIDQLKRDLKQHPHRVELQELADRQIFWHFPDLYAGPWEGWDGRFGAYCCNSCGLRRKRDRLANT
ncbi:MAG: hypothetical protein DWQ29_13795 [Planctomycetota bacterium]|nr:MAG: hypothetical protein DWQ29_13795 [Planctomycetota bacterium]